MAGLAVEKRGYTKAWWAWNVARTTGFWVIGLMNTVLLRPEDVGGWRQWVGMAFLLLAVFDTGTLICRACRAKHAARD